MVNERKVSPDEYFGGLEDLQQQEMQEAAAAVKNDDNMDF